VGRHGVLLQQIPVHVLLALERDEKRAQQQSMILDKVFIRDFQKVAMNNGSSTLMTDRA
jgi:hypothetical protein